MTVVGTPDYWFGWLEKMEASLLPPYVRTTFVCSTEKERNNEDNNHTSCTQQF